MREVDRDDVEGGAEGELLDTWIAEVQSGECRRGEVGDSADARPASGPAEDGNRIELLAGRELDANLMDLFRVAGIRIDVRRGVAEREQTVGAAGVGFRLEFARDIGHRIGRWFLQAVSHGDECCSCQIDQCAGAEDAAVIGAIRKVGTDFQDALDFR